MGASESVHPLEKEVRPDWMEVFKAMRLTKAEVMKLYEIYIKVDCDKSGSIDVVELLTLLDIERTIFTERIFSAFDKDHTGKIDFYEFVVCVWKFCVLGNSAICVFAFDLYDTDADGILNSEQALKMFHELLGSSASEYDNTRVALVALSKGSDMGDVSIADFRPFCKTHQALMIPVFTVQDKLKKTTMGTAFWESIASRRVEVRKGYNVPLSDLMVLHSDRKLFRGLLEDKTILRLDSIMRQVLENTDNAAREEEVTQPTLSQKIMNKVKLLNPLQGREKKQKKSKVSPKGGGGRPKDLLHG